MKTRWALGLLIFLLPGMMGLAAAQTTDNDTLDNDTTEDDTQNPSYARTTTISDGGCDYL